ncbi:MAG: ABC transporter ATP-binding protein [Pseudomonadota bacterium]
MSRLLEVQDLRVEIAMSSGTLHAVRGVDFSIDKGEVLCIVGESGCGKSLTSLALMGLLPNRAERHAKRLCFDGQDLTDANRAILGRLRGNRIAMIFQDPMTSLNPVYTIGNQLMEIYRRHRRGSRAVARARAIDLMTTVGIPAPERRLEQFPHQLSGGLRQRVMIAMALMCEPDLLIADEPTTALDVTIQNQVLALLKRLQRELGLAVVLITHDLGVVAHMADRVAVMYAGEIVEQATTEELFSRPCHPYTRGLMHCLPGQDGKGRLGTIPGMVPAMTGVFEGCAFADRCPHARAQCRGTPIAFASLSPTHAYRCVLPPHASDGHVAAAPS